MSEQDEQIVNREKFSAFAKIASKEQVVKFVLGLFDIYEDTVSRLIQSLLLARWLLVAQFALWCVWLA